METNKLQAQRKAVQSGYTSELIPHDLQHSLTEAKELLDKCKTLQNKQKQRNANKINIHNIVHFTCSRLLRSSKQ